MDINQLRVDTLRSIIGVRKTKDFAEQYDLDASYLSQMLNGHRPMGDRAATKLEHKIGLTTGTLVMPRTDMVANTINGVDSLSYPLFLRSKIRGVVPLKNSDHWSSLEPVTGWLLVPSSDPETYSLRFKGDALAPAIRNGWAVWVEPNHSLVPGEYVIIELLDGTSMIKELLFENEGVFSLMPLTGSTGRLSLGREEIKQIHHVGGILPGSKILYQSEQTL